MSQNNQNIKEDEINEITNDDEIISQASTNDTINENINNEETPDNSNKRYIDIKTLANSVYQEHINLENAILIKNNWEEVKKQLPINRVVKYDDEFNKYDPLIGLKKICKNNFSINHVSYAPSKNLRVFGRLFAQTASLQGLPREIRGKLATNYNDVDMKNCHPTIYLKYCKINNIECPLLEYYVNNREEILNSIIKELEFSKQEAKDLMLAFLNGGKREGLTMKYLVNFQKEMSSIHTKIALLNKDLVRDIKRRKTHNIEASASNVILCRIENECLLYAVQYLKSLGFNVDILIFDGFMVRKDDNNIITPEILKQISKYVCDKTGYYIDFEIKPLDNTLDLTILKNQSTVNLMVETYFKDKEIFENNHLKIMFPPMIITTFGDRNCVLQSEEDAKKSYKHLKTNIRIEGKISRLNFINLWINDEFIRRKEIITFKPPPIIEEPYEFNCWRDFEIRKIPLQKDFNIDDNEPIKRFVEFVDNLLGNRPTFTNFLLALIANMIQRTGERAKVCIILYSIIEGVGKSILNDLIHKLLGDDYCYDCTDIANGLFGKHSMAEFQKLYISLVETKGKDTYLNAETFKSRITDSKRDYEPKGIKSFNSPNFATYLCTTNNHNCVPVNDKSRRFFIASCNNIKTNDKIYFKKFVNEIIEDKYSIRCIFEYLSKFNIESIVPNYDFQGCIPKDDPLYNDLVDYNREIEWNFLEEFVKDSMNGNHLCDVKISTKELYSKFEVFTNNNGENKKNECITSRKFHFNFKQKICQVLQNKAEYKDSIKYSTRDNRIRNKNDEECYSFNIFDLMKYFNITKTQFIDD